MHILERHICPVEGESTFTMEGSGGHYLKQVSICSATSIGATKPKVPTNMMQIELNNITFKTLC